MPAGKFLNNLFPQDPSPMSAMDQKTEPYTWPCLAPGTWALVQAKNRRKYPVFKSLKAVSSVGTGAVLLLLTALSLLSGMVPSAVPDK